MKDKDIQLKGKAEHTQDGSSKVERFHIKPNRISRLWWKAQGLIKARPDFAEMSYEEFCQRVDDQWRELAEEQGLDVNDKSLYKEKTEMIPVDEQGKELI